MLFVHLPKEYAYCPAADFFIPILSKAESSTPCKFPPAILFLEAQLLIPHPSIWLDISVVEPLYLAAVVSLRAASCEDIMIIVLCARFLYCSSLLSQEQMVDCPNFL